MAQSLPVRIGVAGALGRMGRAVAALARDRESVTLGPRFDRPDLAGRTVDGIGLVSAVEAIADADAIVDFTAPAASAALARACAEARGVALVIGSTGFSPDEDAAVAAAARAIPIVRAGNFSLGVNLLLGLVRQAAAALEPADFDIEVFEAHHRRKIDAPSGTALMLGEAAALGRGVDLADVSERARDGLTGPRAEGAIGFSVMRGGGIVGEHSVVFAAEDEIITLSHSARDRSLFARGALAAALWASGRAPGLYDMLDVLGFRSGAGHG
jgi:4-hydroxy-tetrahydrodipicolinate reductase